MCVGRIPVGNQPVEPQLQVTSRRWVRVLLNHEARRCVADEHGAQRGVRSALGNHPTDRIRDLEKPAPARRDVELGLHHGSMEPQRRTALRYLHAADVTASRPRTSLTNISTSTCTGHASPVARGCAITDSKSWRTSNARSTARRKSARSTTSRLGRGNGPNEWSAAPSTSRHGPAGVRGQTQRRWPSKALSASTDPGR